MLSAKGFFPNVLKCIKAGAYDFIVKPFQEEYLVDEIEKTIVSNSYFNTNIITALLSNNEFISSL
jgi:Response regulator containing CheY-like receiver, AAA-type ATPase, and DNA-binding domains